MRKMGGGGGRLLEGDVFLRQGVYLKQYGIYKMHIYR